MIESILSSTALPNLHPAFIHFPIALAVTALAIDVAGLILRRRTWLDAAGALLWSLAALGAIAAVLTGNQAASGMWDVPGAAQAAMADHEELGELTMIALIVIAAMRLLVAWLARADDRIRPRVLRIVVIVIAVLAQLLLVRTADMGGSLVFHHGLGVRSRTPVEPSTAAPAGSPTAPTPVPAGTPPDDRIP